MELRDKSYLDLHINGEPAINQLNKLDKAITDLKQKQKDLVDEMRRAGNSEEQIKSSEAYRELSKEISANRREREALRKEMTLEELSVRELKGLLQSLRKDYENAVDPAIRDALRERIGTVREKLDELGLSVSKQESTWSNFKGWMLGAFAVGNIIQEFFSFVRGGIKNALELSDAMADVAKSTGMTKEQVAELSDQLDQLDTRTAKEGLMDIAKVGGQLGIANDELLGFVESVDKAAVALGDEFTGGAEEAAREIGSLQKLFKETRDMKAGEAINDIGSALNSLGAAGSATGPVVADFTKRIGQLGDLSPEISQTLGLGAAFQELGLTAEISAGGVSNILLTAAKSTYEFAQQLGMSEAAFKKLINTDPNGFLLKLAESLKGLPADEVAKRLDTLGIKSQEATKVMSLLKDQTDFVRQKQELANKAMKEGTSLTQEFAIKNSNAAAEYDKSQKAVSKLATELGLALLPGLTKVITAAAAFVGIIRAVPEFVNENKSTIAALAVALLAFNGNMVLATANSLRLAAAEKARNIWTAAGTTAQWLLNAAMTANPIGAVIAAVALLVAGFTMLYNHSTTVRAGINGLITVFKVAAGEFVKWWDAITSLDFAKAGNIMMDGGKKMAAGFNKGYEEVMNEGRKKDTADHKKHTDDKTTTTTAGAKAGAKAEVDANAAALAAKTIETAKQRDADAKANQKHLEAQQKAEAAKEKKVQEEAEKAHQETLDAKDKATMEAIADDRQRKIALLVWERDQEVKKILASVAAEKEKNEAIDAQDRALKQKIKASDDEYLKTKKEKEDEERKKKALAEQKDLDERKESEFKHSKAVLERQLEDKNLSVNKRRELELALLKLEYEENMRTLNARFQAAIALAEAEHRDTTNLKAAWDAQKTTLEEAYQANTVRINKEAQDAKRAKTQEYFSALGDMMDGNFNTAINLFNKEFDRYKGHLSDKMKAALETGAQIMDAAAQGLALISKLNDQELKKQLTRNEAEKKDALAKWEEKYKKGLIDKATYEIGVNNINKDFDAKEKDLRFKAWRRQKNIDIATAVVNGIQTALKSFASMGWPLGLIGAAAAGIQTALMIKKIKNEEPPVFARGGQLRNAGVPDGPGHGQGGIKLIDSQTGQIRGEMEGGEPIMILSRSTYKNNRGVIDKLLHSSLHQNGKPIFKDGGIFADSPGPGDYPMYLYGGVAADGESQDGGNTGTTGIGGYSGMSTPGGQEAPSSGGTGGSSFSGASGDTVEPSWDTSAGEGYLSEQGDYSGASSGSAQYAADVAASKELMQKIIENTSVLPAMKGVLDSISGQLGNQSGKLDSINSNTQRTADKPTLSTSEIVTAVQKQDKVKDESKFV